MSDKENDKKAPSSMAAQSATLAAQGAAATFTFALPNSPGIGHIQRSESYTEVHSGPLPSPDDLRGYQQLDPSLVSTIVRMAEKEQDHRHSQERSALEYTGKQVFRGQAFGLAVALAGFAATSYLGHLGHPTAAAIVGSVDLLGIVAVFVTGSLARTRSEDQGH